jgi:two-component system, LytTR family, response regulator
MNTILKALIVDDEAHARIALEAMLKHYFPKNLEIVGSVSSLPEAVKSIHKKKPDLVFLDIEMPDYSGLEILDFIDIEQAHFQIVFVTAYQEYAIKAFEITAIGYLLKPLNGDLLKQTVERVMRKKEVPMEQYAALKENLSGASLKKIALQTAAGLEFFELNEIMFFKADSAYTHVFFTDGKKITISKPLQEYQGLEDTGLFVRINRSYIINVEQIAKISRKEGGFVEMKNGEQIALSAEKRQLLYDRFDDITF